MNSVFRELLTIKNMEASKDAQCSAPEHRVLDIGEYEGMLADGSLAAADPVTIIMSVAEYGKRRREGALPDHPIMRAYDLQLYLDRYREIEEEVGRRYRDSGVCGRVSGVVRDGFRRIFS